VVRVFAERAGYRRWTLAGGARGKQDGFRTSSGLRTTLAL